MAIDPNRPVENWELNSIIQWRNKAEAQLDALSTLPAKIDAIQRETNRQSTALFAVDDKNEFGQPGVVPTIREMLLCWKLLRRMVPWIWAAIAGLVSLIVPVIGLLYQLLTQGVIKIG